MPPGIGPCSGGRRQRTTRTSRPRDLRDPGEHPRSQAGPLRRTWPLSSLAALDALFCGISWSVFPNAISQAARLSAIRNDMWGLVPLAASHRTSKVQALRTASTWSLVLLRLPFRGRAYGLRRDSGSQGRHFPGYPAPRRAMLEMWRTHGSPVIRPALNVETIPRDDGTQDLYNQPSRNPSEIM